MGIGALMLYLSIVTFAIGLIVFFWHLYPPIGILIASIATIFVALHVVTSIQPCFYTDSPFKSPFSYLLVLCSSRLRGHPGGFEEREKDDVHFFERSLDKDIARWVFLDGARKQRGMSV